MEKAAKEPGLNGGYESSLKQILPDYFEIICTSFSSGPEVRLPLLNIKLTSQPKPIKVRQQMFLQEQRDFTKKFMDKLVLHRLTYPNFTSKWACEPLLIPKSGGPFRFKSWRQAFQRRYRQAPLSNIYFG